MLIGFLGCPSSGKTTLAAKAFVYLKELGYAAEFVPEQARVHIAEKKLIGGSIDSGLDQVAIMESQYQLEELMLQSGTELVVTDTCIYNTLLYMDDGTRQLPEVVAYVGSTRYTLLFYCPPIALRCENDPNRLHNFEQSVEIDKAIPEVLDKYAPKGLPIVALPGDLKAREAPAVTALHRLLFEG